MIRRPPRSTLDRSSAASDVYKRQLPIYDPITGGCRDGLHSDRLNENQGAESTLAFLQSLLELRLTEQKHISMEIILK